MPMIVSTPFRLPRRPILIASPSASGFVGSPTRQWSGTWPLSAIHRSTLAVPLIDGPSSSPVISRLIEPPVRPPFSSRYWAAAAAKQATAPFMSTAPRPHRRPSRSAAENGGCVQAASSPGGTTSTCPAKQKCGRPSPMRANRLSTSAVPSSLNCIRVQRKPDRSSTSCRTSSAPDAAGVTLRQRISALVIDIGSLTDTGILWAKRPRSGARLNGGRQAQPASPAATHGTSGRCERIGAVPVGPDGAAQEAEFDQRPDRYCKAHGAQHYRAAEHVVEHAEHPRQEIEQQQPPPALVAVVQPLDADGNGRPDQRDRKYRDQQQAEPGGDGHDQRRKQHDGEAQRGDKPVLGAD